MEKKVFIRVELSNGATHTIEIKYKGKKVPESLDRFILEHIGEIPNTDDEEGGAV